MDDIARMLGVSKKTIYTYIENKKELVVKVIENFISKEHAEVDVIRKDSDNAIDEMMRIAEYVLATMHKIKPSLTYDLKKYHPKAWQLIETRHFNHIREVMESNINRGIKEGYYREEIEPDMCSRLYVGMAHTVFNPDTLMQQDYNIPHLYHHIITYHMNGIMNSSGRKKFKTYIKNFKDEK